jgi:hypothetical protein
LKLQRILVVNDTQAKLILNPEDVNEMGKRMFENSVEEDVQT